MYVRYREEENAVRIHLFVSCHGLGVLKVKARRLDF